MSIPMKKYVAITSAIANTSAASRKELILRVFTTNPLFAANTVYEFTSSEDVSNFAGALSAEAKLSAEYFGWISKTATKAQKISFMRYSFDALAPYLYSVSKLTPLASFKAVTDGSMTVNIGGTAYTLTGVNFADAEAYTDIATTVQTALRENTDGGALWTNATVTYNAGNNSFMLTGGETGDAEISYAAAANEGTDISALLGWNIASAPILSTGTTAQTIGEILNKTIDISTNFLTFGFINSSDCYDNLDAIGAWVDEQNNEYRLCFDLGQANYQEGIATAQKYTGLTAHFNINYGMTGINPAWLMSAILPATTNYNRVNGVKNYMFQEFPQQAVAVGVDDGNFYQTLDNLCINYNGQTQKSGRNISFYQNGFNAEGTDTAVYDNEAWLKDAIATEMLNSFIGLDFISADNDGIAILSGNLTSICGEALTNHVFSKGKELTTAQKAYITQLTGDENVWLDVQNNGYWFDVFIEPETSGNATIFVGKYTLIYLKNDVIRKVVGSNILI